MFSFIWPATLIVFSNILYQICAKGIPTQMNTYASMAVTYAVATVFSAIMYFVTNKGGWKVSTLATVTNAFLAIALIFLGFFMYKESITWSKVLGVSICLVGLWFIKSGN